MEGVKLSALGVLVLALGLCTNVNAVSSNPSSIATNTYNVTAHNQFIEASCNVTMYPEVCIQSLSVYSNKIKSSYPKLVSASLSQSLKCARNTFSVVLKLLRSSTNLKPVEIAAVKDCVHNLHDSIEVIGQSLAELKMLNATDFELKMSNIMTWMSAALSDDDTCLNGLLEGSVNAVAQEFIRDKVSNLAKLTSNALAFVNHLDFSRLST